MPIQKRVTGHCNRLRLPYFLSLKSEVYEKEIMVCHVKFFARLGVFSSKSEGYDHKTKTLDVPVDICQDTGTGACPAKPGRMGPLD